MGEKTMNDKIKKAATLPDSDAAPQEILPQAPCATSVAHDLKAADIREDKVTDKELIEMMRTQYAVTRMGSFSALSPWSFTQ